MKNGAIWKIITAVIIPILFFIGSSVIANDKDSRARDTDLTTALTATYKEVCAKIEASYDKQEAINKELQVAQQTDSKLLVQILTELKYLNGRASHERPGTP